MCKKCPTGWVEEPTGSIAGYTDRRFKFHYSKRGLPRNFMGVEMEVSKLTLCPTAVSRINAWKTKWQSQVSYDGSVRGKGLEFKTCPAQGVKFKNQLKELCDIFKDHGGGADSSCGLHLHVNSRRIPQQDLAKIIPIWKNLEDAMYEVGGKSRARNSYCAPWGQRALSFKKKPEYVQETFQNILSSYSRYRSLNFSALGKYKTVENRMHKGTVSFKEIWRWALIHDNIWSYIRNSPMEEILETKDFKFLMDTQKSIRPKKVYHVERREPRTAPA